MTFDFRKTIADVARLAANSACFGGAAARPAPSVVDLAPHEWRCIAERIIPPHEHSAGARICRT